MPISLSKAWMFGQNLAPIMVLIEIEIKRFDTLSTHVLRLATYCLLHFCVQIFVICYDNIQVSDLNTNTTFFLSMHVTFLYENKPYP